MEKLPPGGKQLFNTCSCVRIYLPTYSLTLQLPANGSVSLEAVKAVPTVLWWIPEQHTDQALDCIAYTGLVLSAMLLIHGAGNALVFAVLWALYHSIVNVGQTW